MKRNFVLLQKKTASAKPAALHLNWAKPRLNPWKYIQFILSDIPGTAFLEYPEYLKEYMPWDPMVQKLCR